MKKVITTIVAVLVVTIGMAQNGRLVLNNDAYLVIDNSAFVVIDNPNVNALTVIGSGGNVISENETDVIKWNVGTSTGAYTIPWTTTPAVQGGNDTKIPQEINITSAGVGGGHLILSTYETATDLNTVYPALVTSMDIAGSGGTDGSLMVVDRFWHSDAASYITRPGVEMIINYDPAANEIAGTNTIIEANLLAQRWNSNINSWEVILFGVNDAANDRVTNIVASPADFYENWILVDQTTPLPVELKSFESECLDGAVELIWSTVTEQNNDYFELEKSHDGTSFFTIATVAGAGNSTTPQSYSFKDESAGVAYYRLTQVDFDGQRDDLGVVASDCSTDDDNEVSAYFNGDVLVLDSDSGGIYDLLMYDSRGRLVANGESLLVSPGKNSINFEKTLESGVYHLKVVTKSKVYSVKVSKFTL